MEYRYVFLDNNDVLYDTFSGTTCPSLGIDSIMSLESVWKQQYKMLAREKLFEQVVPLKQLLKTTNYIW